ncbi:MAG TPA: 7,8-didemethyl-8-hydroxy-5-deazariboflavin synthase CofG, partial [Thermodesulfobacteriota bacterium]|nr:7,8-didemethyl-8-hydroxy-5-deazariboflavin synthase CofG [Thermodesulfobacteriota bacterium]
TSFVNDARQLFATETIRTMLNGLSIEQPNILPPSPKLERILEKAISGETITREDALHLIDVKDNDLIFLILAAGKIRERGKNSTVTFSKNVFVPLTRLCRDNCGYCTFKIEPEEGELLVPPDEVLSTAREGARLGCTELLFVTGDKPELKYPVYRDALGKLGYKTTAEYLVAMSEAGLKENIFPHTNLGVANREELAALRESNASQGLMLETISTRLLKKGEAHHRSPDKVPKLRIRTMEYAGELRIPWTSGILVGIGETWEERVDSLFAIKRLWDDYGHIQEIIIQNFSPKPGIRMEKHPSPTFLDMTKTVAISRLIFGERMNIQVPPNLNRKEFAFHIIAGANDLGGVSPLTVDYVNPEAPWPQVTKMESVLSELGLTLRERLPVYPEFIKQEFLSEKVLDCVKKATDNEGYVREEEQHEQHGGYN